VTVWHTDLQVTSRFTARLAALLLLLLAATGAGAGLGTGLGNSAPRLSRPGACSVPRRAPQFVSEDPESEVPPRPVLPGISVGAPEPPTDSFHRSLFQRPPPAALLVHA